MAGLTFTQGASLSFGLYSEALLLGDKAREAVKGNAIKARHSHDT